jgi:type IX secretion system PorP/SprF family membrane protein
MRKRAIHILLSLFFTLFVGIQAKGQEFPWSLQYVTNMNTINPAYVGMWDRAGLFFSSRSNWVGIKGAPTTQQFTYSSPIRGEGSGVGLNVQRKDVGLEKSLFVTGDYSFQVRLDVYNYIRFGFRAGFVNYNNNLALYETYPDLIPDPEFTTDVRQYFMTVFGIGAVLFDEKYYVSLSIPQVINNTFHANQNGFSSQHELRTVYLSGGYVFRLPNTIMFRPNLLVVATSGKSVYFDASSIIYLPGDLQFGLNIRSNGAVCLSGQYTFNNNLRIGYASEYHVIQDIRKFQLGSYEIMVGYDFNLYRKKNTRPYYF